LSQIEDLKNEFIELEKSFQDKKLPNFYINEWLSQEFRRDLKNLLNLHKDLSSQFTVFKSRFKQLLQSPKILIQKNADSLFQDINPKFQAIERFLDGIQKSEGFESNFIQLFNEMKAKLASIHLLFINWIGSLPGEMLNSVGSIKDQILLKIQYFENQLELIHNKWDTYLESNVNVTHKVISDLSRIFGKKIPLREISEETDMSPDKLYDIISELIRNKTLKGQIEMYETESRSNSILVLQEKVFSFKETQMLTERKEILKKILLRYSRIEITKLASLLKLSDSIDLELWLLNLPAESGLYLESTEKGTILIISESAKDQINNVIQKLDEIKSFTH